MDPIFIATPSEEDIKAYKKLEGKRVYLLSEEEIIFPPYNAIQISKSHAEVNEILCKGCGTCLANCPSEAITLKYYRESQYENQIDSILYEY